MKENRKIKKEQRTITRTPRIRTRKKKNKTKKHARLSSPSVRGASPHGQLPRAGVEREGLVAVGLGAPRVRLGRRVPVVGVTHVHPSQGNVGALRL